VPKNYTGVVTFFDWYAFKFYSHGTVSLSLRVAAANTRVSQVLHHGKPDTGPARRLSAIDRTYEGHRCEVIKQAEGKSGSGVIFTPVRPMDREGSEPELADICDEPKCNDGM
jgi:hypothetical protein